MVYVVVNENLLRLTYELNLKHSEKASALQQKAQPLLDTPFSLN